MRVHMVAMTTRDVGVNTSTIRKDPPPSVSAHQDPKSATIGNDRLPAAHSAIGISSRNPAERPTMLGVELL
jgi:hypothetical protein